MSTVNSYDACYPIALILNGAILGFLDWDRIRNKKPIQIAILIYALCNINFCLCFTMLGMGLPALEPGTWGWYLWNTLSIITDGIADFGLDVAYILRITALIQNKQLAKFMWCVLIAPIIYLGATGVSLTLLFSSTVPIAPSVSMQIFGAGKLKAVKSIRQIKLMRRFTLSTKSKSYPGNRWLISPLLSRLSTLYHVQRTRSCFKQE